MKYIAYLLCKTATNLSYGWHQACDLAAIGAIVIGLSGAASAQITNLFNTGVDNAGAPLPIFSQDSHYSLTLTADPLCPIGCPTRVEGPHPFPTSWVNTNNLISDWIRPEQTSPPGIPLFMYGACNNGNYVYETTFNVGAYRGVKIAGRAAADDRLDGISLNGGPPIPMSAGQTAYKNFVFTSGFIPSAVNTLEFLFRNIGNAPLGLRVEMEASVLDRVTLSGLRNFDVVSPLDVNDFHITLKGIYDPRLPANGGTQILGTFPAPFNVPNPNPPGWYPPLINSTGNTTVVSYGGPGAQFISNQTMHFGVSLTAKGEADLNAICMHWTRDGMPLDEADVNIPITIITDQAAPGETDIQIVNQICPDDPVTPPRWLGPIHLSVVDRHANLDELVAASPIIEEASVFYDGNTFLAPGEQFTLTDFDAAAPIAPGQSVVVWYDVFADNGRAPGALVGTSYSAFNVGAVPEPTSVGLLVAVAIVLVGNGRQFLSKRPRQCRLGE